MSNNRLIFFGIVCDFETVTLTGKKKIKCHVQFHCLEKASTHKSNIHVRRNNVQFFILKISKDPLFR